MTFKTYKHLHRSIWTIISRNSLNRPLSNCPFQQKRQSVKRPYLANYLNEAQYHKMMLN